MLKKIRSETHVQTFCITYLVLKFQLEFRIYVQIQASSGHLILLSHAILQRSLHNITLSFAKFLQVCNDLLACLIHSQQHPFTELLSRGP